MRNAFKALGHNVITCGPHGENYGGECLSKHDIPLYDKRDKPEYWTYTEILAKVKEKYGDIKLDFILQIEPNFHFCGDKPKDIPCFYWAIDFHRGGMNLINAARKGQFDHIFVALDWAIPYFEANGFKQEQLSWLPLAFDSTRIPEGLDQIEPECDIVFLGTTGLRTDWLKESPPAAKYRWMGCYEDEALNLEYFTFLEGLNSYGLQKYIGYENSSFEYAERAEYLIRLSEDFNVRIYDRCDPPQYWQALRKGKIGFNCSLRYDLSNKIFEIPAAGRLLCTDYLPMLDNIFQAEELGGTSFPAYHYLSYQTRFQPQFANFDLDYQRLKAMIFEALITYEEKQDEIKETQRWVLDNHSYLNRAKDIQAWAQLYK